ncbi:MAG: hypothetical protein LAO51_05090 [Acidobacteriia bacterium]|nr:hypothetical protein [Terriglobia bacterium]
MEADTQRREGAEFTVLQRYGLRWAVLAAWYFEMAGRGAAFEPDFLKSLDLARTKIAAGTFSTCTIGCDLGGIEGTLVSTAATFDPPSVDAWLERLGQSMSNPESVQKLIDVPAVRSQYMKCGILPCDCK